MRHRVLRDGKVAGRLRSGFDIWEVQGENGAVRSVDVLHNEVRVVGQGFAARIEYVMRVQKLVTEWGKVSSLTLNQVFGMQRRNRNCYRFRDQLPRHPIKDAES